MILIKHHAAEDVHAAERRGLGDGPLHGSFRLSAGGPHGESFRSAPESAGRVVAGQAGIGVDVASDVDSIGRCAQADDFGVEADGDIYFVFAGEEEKGIALRAKLIVLLHCVDCVYPGLYIGRGHGWIENQNVGTPVGLYGRSGGEAAARQKR